MSTASALRPTANETGGIQSSRTAIEVPIFAHTFANPAEPTETVTGVYGILSGRDTVLPQWLLSLMPVDEPGRYSLWFANESVPHWDDFEGNELQLVLPGAHIVEYAPEVHGPRTPYCVVAVLSPEQLRDLVDEVDLGEWLETEA